ncbi:MAG: S-layer homology domain-containing protein [Candidatus Sericytochromatia bacterium]|nr:S-layer homology domain-containing protein [Candidatus Sericytochromatia bacterium]
MRRQTVLAGILALLLASPAAAQEEADFGAFGDIPVDHWAFLTVETLVKKYAVMAGFPDGSFRGDQRVSRYELAAALDKVMAAMQAGRPVASGLAVAAVPPPAPARPDVEAVKAVVESLALTELLPRLKQWEDKLQQANTVGPTAVRMSGSIGSVWMDNTQDDQAPFARSNLGLNLASTAQGWEMAASMNGALPATTVGNMPGPAGGGKPPNTDWRFGGANVTTTLADTRIRVGMFSPASIFYPSSDNPAAWGGIVGNGFIGPDVNTVRWGPRAAAVAATREFGPLRLATAVTPTVVLGGLAARVTNWLTLKAAADVDQPDWWGVTPNRTTATNYTVVADANFGAVVVSFEGVLARNLLRGSTVMSWALWNNIRLNVGAVYSESEKAVTELTPGLSLAVPSMGPGWMPAVLVGIKEPQVLWASDPKLNPGPGSLLGEQAGLSVVTNWNLGPQGWPNITFEYNLQQPVLFYEIYDATFALSVSRPF